jgi:hypothetical protein
MKRLFINDVENLIYIYFLVVLYEILKENEAARMKSRVNKNETKTLGEAPEIMLPEFNAKVWDEDMDMVNLRIHFRPQIRRSWDKGIRAFVEGDWNSATTQLHEVLEMTKGRDGPSKHLLKKMEAYSYKVPVDWKGFRAL